MDAIQGRGGSGDQAIYVRADGAAPYAVVAQVMARLSTHGFSKLNLVTDTGPASAAGLRDDRSR